MSKVILNISDTQSHHSGEEAVRMTVIGELMREQDNYILTYPDGEDGETRVRVTSGGTVEILKENAENSESFEMILEPSKAFSSYYETPYGKTDALIIPTMVDANMRDQAGSIELEYVIRVLGQQIIAQRSLTYAMDHNSYTGGNINEN